MKILKILFAKLSSSSKNSSVKIPRWLVFSFLFGGIIGFLDSVYLTAQHYNSLTAPCFIVKGCDKVLTSSFSEVFGLPVALLGSAYYLLIIFLIIAYIDSGKNILMGIISRLTVVGLIASLWFLFIQFFIIRAFCIYCLFSAAISITFFGFGLILLKILGTETHWRKFIQIIKNQ